MRVAVAAGGLEVPGTCAGVPVANVGRMRTPFCLIILAGCIEGPEAKGPSPDIPAQGIYGTLTQTSDVQGVSDAPYANAAVTAYVGTNLAAADVTASDGTYGLPVQPGTYVVCTLNQQPSKLLVQWQQNCAGQCTQLVVGTGAIEANWASNLSGGWWDAGDHCPH